VRNHSLLLSKNRQYILCHSLDTRGVKDFCEPIADSISEMVYDSKSKDEKLLDDFSTDVDTYDADFYSWSYFINYFHPIGGRK
jgi:hypothetical protein